MIQHYHALTLVSYLINLRVGSYMNCTIGSPFYLVYMFSMLFVVVHTFKILPKTITMIRDYYDLTN